MLYQLGSSVFEVYPLNATELAHAGKADFAEKAVLGRRPPLESVGEGSETHRITAKLFPARFGGLGSLDALHAQRVAGMAVPFMRGDGTPLGWFVIEQIDEKSSHLDAHGVGQVIEVEISLKRDDAPSLGNLYSILSGLL